MKINCRKEMMKHWMVDDMRLNLRKEVSSMNRNTKRRMNKFFKRKWIKEADRQMREEIENQ